MLQVFVTFRKSNTLLRRIESCKADKDDVPEGDATGYVRQPAGSRQLMNVLPGDWDGIGVVLVERRS